jgi:hypothetical protein
MVGEFTGWDENLVGVYGLRQFSLIPFGIGICILLYYYVFIASRKGFKQQMFAETELAIEQELARVDEAK